MRGRSAIAASASTDARRRARRQCVRYASGVTEPDLDLLVARAMARLRSPDGTALAELVELLLEAALSRPIGAAVDPDRVVAMTVAVVEATRVERALAELVRPAWDRQRGLLATRGDRVGDWLPDGGRALLEEVLAGARVPRGAWTKGLVASADVRELIAPILQDTLLAFARKLPLVGGVTESEGPSARAAGKLFGMARELAHNAGERAGKLADIGRGVLGGIGGEMEKRVATAAREFSHGAFDPLEASFLARLRSDEGQQILARMRTRAVDGLLRALAADVAADLDTLPRQALDRLVAQSIAFGAARPELAQMLRAEVDAFLKAHEGKNVGEVLEAWSLRELAVTELRRELSTIAAAAAAGPRAERWLRALLAP